MKPAFGAIVCPFGTPHVTGIRQLRLSAAGEALPLANPTDGEGLPAGEDAELTDGTGVVLTFDTGSEADVHALSTKATATAALRMHESTS